MQETQEMQLPSLGRDFHFPWKRKSQPTPVFLPGKFQRQRSLVGYSTCGCKELDMTEQLSMQTLYAQCSAILFLTASAPGNPDYHTPPLPTGEFLMPLSGKIYPWLPFAMVEFFWSVDWAEFYMKTFLTLPTQFFVILNLSYRELNSSSTGFYWYW